MRTNKNQYDKMVKRASPPSRVLKNCIWAFFTGGTICLIGEVMVKAYMQANYTQADARTLTSITLVGMSAVFTAMGWYSRLAKRAGAGTLVPITGFANAVVSPAIEFKSEGYITGVASKMFIIAGPVIVYGIIASVVYGLILYLKGRFGI
ncbi:MAG: stage V sporulation protein AC [Oscillospiraceae bacterium]|nr:stage V sporulation protein AC [Oscillospiraceae bacterium]MBQ5325474.1 stage V sporulation protein AC [Oscillospiraceae bacterium]